MLKESSWELYDALRRLAAERDRYGGGEVETRVAIVGIVQELRQRGHKDLVAGETAAAAKRFSGSDETDAYQRAVADFEMRKKNLNLFGHPLGSRRNRIKRREGDSG